VVRIPVPSPCLCVDGVEFRLCNQLTLKGPPMYRNSPLETPETGKQQPCRMPREREREVTRWNPSVHWRTPAPARAG